MSPQLIFGTASFGMEYTVFNDPGSVADFLGALSETGITRLDTAARYPPLNPGESERLIGQARPASNAFAVDTKVNTDLANDGSGDLAPAAVAASVSDSLQRLATDKVHTLHIHRPDPATPVLDQVRAFNAQIEQGRCAQWGVSNVSPAQLAEMVQACDAHGLRKPACYQGDYNLVTRGMEKKLLPLLREHGIAYNAFRPLAGGFLTAKLLNDKAEGTRFASDNAIGQRLAQGLYGAEDLRAAVRAFDADVTAQGLTPVETAMRWIAHHSALRDGDGIIVGASKPAQVVEAAKWVSEGPLPAPAVEAAERLWTALEASRGEII